MNLGKNNFFLIGLLIFSLFATDMSLVLVETFTETKIEHFLEEKTPDDYISSRIVKNNSLNSFPKRDLYISPIYSYHHIKLVNKPPIT